MSALLALLASTSAPLPDLTWLAGYWLSCEEEQEVSETWSDPRESVLRGTSFTVRQGTVSWEQARIGPSDGSISFFAAPSGQQPAEFRLKSAGARSVVFENLAHDFPQRVIYWRSGDRLNGRVEGRSGTGFGWSYHAAPLNSRCAIR